MKKIILSICAVLLLASCTNKHKTVKVLEEAGYKDISTTGYSFFMCGEGDMYATGFEATSPSGQHVEGSVCGGFTKGYTIRLK